MRRILFLARKSWSNVPRNGEDATVPSITEYWRSPFHGKTIEDVVAFMKELPEDCYIYYYHFAILGEEYIRRKMVMICRIGDEYLVGNELDALPGSVDGSYGCHDFEEVSFADT